MHSRSQSRAGCITHRIASHRIAHSPTESLNHTAIRAAILRPVRTQCVVNPRCAVWSGVAPRSRSATWGFFPPYHRTADRASSWQWRDWPWCHRNMWRFVLFVSYYYYCVMIKCIITLSVLLCIKKKPQKMKNQNTQTQNTQTQKCICHAAAAICCGWCF